MTSPGKRQSQDCLTSERALCLSLVLQTWIIPLVEYLIPLQEVSPARSPFNLARSGPGMRAQGEHPA